MYLVSECGRASLPIGLSGHYQDKFCRDRNAIRDSDYRGRVTLDEGCDVFAVSAFVDVSVRLRQTCDVKFEVSFTVVAVFIVCNTDCPVTGLVCQRFSLFNHHLTSFVDL